MAPNDHSRTRDTGESMIRVRRCCVLTIAFGILSGIPARLPVYAAPPGEFKLLEKRMSNRRSFPSAVMLSDGRVLVTGGEDLNGQLVTLKSADLFDPVTETITPTGPMNEGRITHTTVRLADGRVLVVGGFGDGE